MAGPNFCSSESQLKRSIEALKSCTAKFAKQKKKRKKDQKGVEEDVQLFFISALGTLPKAKPLTSAIANWSFPLD